jgi:hypothetical protein
MGSACGTYDKEEEYFRVLVGRLKGKNQHKDLGVPKRKILKWIFMN